MAALVDTNVLVYRFDPSAPAKQRIAVDLLREGLRHGMLVVPHQAVAEFVAATTRRRGVAGAPDGRALLSSAEASREAEELMLEFVMVYPTEEVVRTALRGAATYGLSWYDAHLWAYAEVYGLDELLSEDFEHGRLYGSVRAVNPFLPADTVHENAARYE